MQVTIRQFVRTLQEGLAQAAQQRSLQLGKGQCKNMEEYKRAVGHIDGLNGAGVMAESMMRQLEDAEANDGLPEMPPGDGA